MGYQVIYKFLFRIKNIIFKFFHVSFLLSLYLFSNIGCNEDELISVEEGNILTKVNFSLSLADSSASEIWVNVNVSEVLEGTRYRLLRNNQLVREFDMKSKNTVIHDMGINPSGVYTYKLYMYVNIPPYYALADSSAEYCFRTTDSTSHNMNWQITKISNYGILNDIKVIDDNNIWAVGYFHNDLPAVDAYNLARWDGNSWNLTALMDTISGVESLSNLSAISVVNNNDISLWGRILYHWNGSMFNYSIPGFQENIISSAVCKISENNIYIGDRSGSLEHFNGSGWTKIAIPEDCPPIKSIHSTSDGRIVWAVAHDFISRTSMVLRISDNVITTMFKGGTNSYQYRDVWSNRDDRIFFAVGNTIYNQDTGNKIYLRVKAIFKDEIFSIDGESDADFFVCGQNGYLGHYNGASVKSYNVVFGPQYTFTHISAEKNTVVAGTMLKYEDHSPVYTAIGTR